MFFNGADIGFLLWVGVLVAIVVIPVATATARRWEDPTGTRPLSAYLSIVELPFLAFAVVGLGAAVNHFVSSFADTSPAVDAASGFSPPDLGVFDGSTLRVQAVRILLLVAIAAVVAIGHERRIRSVLSDASFAGTAGARVLLATRYVGCAVWLTLLLGGAWQAIGGLLRVVFPGTATMPFEAVMATGDARIVGLAALLGGALVAAASVWLLLDRWRAAEGLRGATAPIAPTPPSPVA